MILRSKGMWVVVLVGLHVFADRECDKAKGGNDGMGGKGAGKRNGE